MGSNASGRVGAKAIFKCFYRKPTVQLWVRVAILGRIQTFGISLLLDELCLDSTIEDAASHWRAVMVGYKKCNNNNSNYLTPLILKHFPVKQITQLKRLSTIPATLLAMTTRPVHSLALRPLFHLAQIDSQIF
jgi:hypothetical protein